MPTHVLIQPRPQAAGRTVFGPPPKPPRVSLVLSLFSHQKREVLSWVIPGLDWRGGAEAEELRPGHQHQQVAALAPSAWSLGFQGPFFCSGWGQATPRREEGVELKGQRVKSRLGNQAEPLLF